MGKYISPLSSYVSRVYKHLLSSQTNKRGYKTTRSSVHTTCAKVTTHIQYTYSVSLITTPARNSLLLSFRPRVSLLSRFLTLPTLLPTLVAVVGRFNPSLP
jgi:hypothetical protein